MRLLRLRLTAFRQFDDVSVELAPGVTIIRGGNGAGKSTLLEGIVWALFGAGAARRSEASLRSTFAERETCAELDVEHEGAAFRIRRVLESDANTGGVTLQPLVMTLPPELLPEPALDAAARELFLRTSVTGRRELQALVQLGPAERLGALARLIGATDPAPRPDAARAASRGSGIVATAVSTLEEELADSTRRMETLASAPDLLTQYGAELERARVELADAESHAERLHDDWAQKRQDVQTRLDAHRRRSDDLKVQIERLSAAGAVGACPTCEQPLGSGAERVVGRLDDEYYITTQDVKWLLQRQAQLERRPPDVMAAETQRERLRARVADRAERVARCEQAVQELWAVAQEKQRTLERIEALTPPSAPQLTAADTARVAAVAGEYVARVSGWRYTGIVLDADGRVHGEMNDGSAQLVSGADEDLFALALRLAAAAIAAERAGASAPLLLDEPFGSLDVARRRALVDLLRDFLPLRGQVIITTHDTDTADLADHVIHVTCGDAEQRSSRVTAAPRAAAPA
jgi:DNA repair exonuclease SbcCD ATPase subunit